jgi:hypothetical protein
MTESPRDLEKQSAKEPAPLNEIAAASHTAIRSGAYNRLADAWNEADEQTREWFVQQILNKRPIAWPKV